MEHLLCSLPQFPPQLALNTIILVIYFACMDFFTPSIWGLFILFSQNTQLGEIVISLPYRLREQNILGCQRKGLKRDGCNSI